MMRRSACRIAMAGILLTAAAAAEGCGDGPQSSGPAPIMPPRAPGAAAAARAGGSEEEAKVAVPNPRWPGLAPYFDRFLQEPQASHRDSFRSYLTAHITRPELPAEEPEDGAGEADTEMPDEPVAQPLVPEPVAPPLLRYGVDEYKLLMVMSGTSIPKAVIEDPIGNTWVIRRDSPLGNKGGVVESITQYAVIVREPDADNPVEKTVRPLIFEGSARAEGGEQGGLYGAERLTGPPL